MNECNRLECSQSCDNMTTRHESTTSSHDCQNANTSHHPLRGLMAIDDNEKQRKLSK